MKLRKTIIFSSLVLIKSAILSAEPDFSVRIGTDHPRLILSRQELASMRERVQSGRDPWNSTWTVLQKRVDVFCAGKWQPAVYTGNDSRKFYDAAICDGSAARDLALAYHITGNSKYAFKAVAIISAWLQPEILPGTKFDSEKNFPNLGMLVARGSFPFLYAYDLLAADKLISPELRDRFAVWLRILEGQIEEGSHRWELNDYFDKQYYQNHLVADAVGLMAIGIILQDTNLVQYAVDSVENPRDIKEQIVGLILMEGDTPYYREPEKFPVQTGEIMDRYRHFEMGGHYGVYVTKPDRGFQYCGLSTTLLVIAAEMGRNNGFDLYNWTAPSGETLRLPLDFYADFYITGDASIQGGFYTGEDAWIGANDSTTHALWEVAASRFPKAGKYRDVLRAYERGSQDIHLLGPVTLTHGPSLDPDAASAVTPGAAPDFSAIIAPQRPRLLFTGEQLRKLSAAVQNKEEPFYSAARLLQVRCEKGLEYKANPYTGDNSDLFYKHCLGPAGLARNLAMGRYISGDKKYALKAAEILNDWAEACLGKALDHKQDYPNASMKIARTAFPFFCAYDLIKADGVLTAQQDETAQAWFRQLAEEIKEGVREWHKNDYFNKQYYQNHLVAHDLGLLAIGYALGDEELVQFALNSAQNPRDLKELVAGAILMKGDEPCHREPKGWPLDDGEIYDRYRHHTGPMKGLQYTHLTMTLLATSARIAGNNGTDLAGYTAPGGENLRLPFEYYADFYRLKDAAIKNGIFKGETDRLGKAGDEPGMYELGLWFYPDCEPVKQLLATIDRGAAYTDLLGYTAFFARSVSKSQP